MPAHPVPDRMQAPSSLFWKERLHSLTYHPGKYRVAHIPTTVNRQWSMQRVQGPKSELMTLDGKTGCGLTSVEIRSFGIHA